jgi:hypothetical protein
VTVGDTGTGVALAGLPAGINRDPGFFPKPTLAGRPGKWMPGKALRGMKPPVVAENPSRVTQGETCDAGRALPEARDGFSPPLSTASPLPGLADWALRDTSGFR